MSSSRTRPIILGTAGHIDHGKTSLVRALTGIDTDRLPEEKARGITIELGFAHLDLGPYRFGLVDVPGHERFVKTMVAGAVGVDLVIFVVAADEGVMPQTREHLDICQLLGIRAGVVALTKRDLVDEAFAGLVIDDLRQTLRGTFLEKAPIVPCSATTRLGLDVLERTLLELAPSVPAKDPEGLLRLPLDRVFTMHGFGTVVTGTLAAGGLRLGDELVALPGGHGAKARGLEVHGESVGEAFAGQRVAVNLGGLPREDVARGETLTHPGELVAGSVVDVRLRLLRVCRAPLQRRSKVLFHAGTAMVEATALLVDRDQLDAGETGLAQLHLAEPRVLLPGDRFILRGFAIQEGYGTTLGGGEVLRVLSPRLRRSGTQVASLLRELEQAAPEQRVAAEVRLAAVRGLGRTDLQARVSFPPRLVDGLLAKLLSSRQLVRFDREQGALAHADTVRFLAERMEGLVDTAHREAPTRKGIGREELRSRLPADLPVRLFALVLDGLVERGTLVAERDLVRRPDHAVEKAATRLPALAERLHAVLRTAGLSPPRIVELPALLERPEEEVRAALDLLVQNGRALRVGRELAFASDLVDTLRDRLTAWLKSHETIDPQAWKELCGTTRKYTTPLAEHFDAEKLTIRVGDVRKLRGR